jgi:hypothetical protein
LYGKVWKDPEVYTLRELDSDQGAGVHTYPRIKNNKPPELQK